MSQEFSVPVGRWVNHVFFFNDSLQLVMFKICEIMSVNTRENFSNRKSQDSKNRAWVRQDIIWNIAELAFVQVCFSAAVVEHRPEATGGGQGLLQLAGHSPLSGQTREGTHTGIQTWGQNCPRGHGGNLLAALLSMTSSNYVLIKPVPPDKWWAPRAAPIN